MRGATPSISSFGPELGSPSMESPLPVQIRQPKFVDHFWNNEVGNFHGWEIVTKRLKDGRQAINEYLEFLKQRAALEEQLGRALVKLAKSMVIKDDIGSMGEAWDILRTQTEASGLSHIKTCHQILGEMSRVNEISEGSRERRKVHEDNVRGLQQSLKFHWKKLLEAKRSYDTRCKEEVASNQQYYREVSRHGQGSREAEKALTRHQKIRSTLEASEKAYHGSVASAEEYRKDWEQQTERALKEFQSLEEHRLVLVRDSLWKFANISSQTSVADDAASELIRQKLECFNLEVCVADFINNNSTGENRPETIEFLPQPTSSSLGMGKAEDVAEEPWPWQPARKTLPGGGGGFHRSASPSGLKSSFSSRSLDPHSDRFSSESKELFGSLNSSGGRVHPSVDFLASTTRSTESTFKSYPSQVHVRSSSARARSSSVAVDSSHHPTPAVPSRPKKPPRLLLASYEQTGDERLGNSSSYWSGPPLEQPYFRGLMSSSNGSTVVVNNEYFSLGGDRSRKQRPSSSSSSSDLNSPQKSSDSSDCSVGDQQQIRQGPTISSSSPSPCRSVSRPEEDSYGQGAAPPIPAKHGVGGKGQRLLGQVAAAPKAVVVFDYEQKDEAQVSMERSQIVTVLECKPGSDWWRVQDSIGRQGYYPSNYLKMI